MLSEKFDAAVLNLRGLAGEVDEAAWEKIRGTILVLDGLSELIKNLETCTLLEVLLSVAGGDDNDGYKRKQ